MAKQPFFPFFYQDFIHGTRKFSSATKGHYLMLLCEQWDEGALEESDFDSAKRELPEIEFNRLFRKFKSIEAGFQNERLEETRKYVTNLSAIRSEMGKKGGRPRKQSGKQNDKQTESKQESKTKAKGIANDIANEKHPNPNPNPNPKSKLKSKSKGKREDKTLVSFPTEKSQVAFDLFWTHFPCRRGKKRGKHRAITKFLELTDEEQMDCGLAAMNFAKSEMAQEDIGIMDPHRFIWSTLNNEAEWKNWITPEEPTKPKKSKFENSADANERVLGSVLNQLKPNQEDEHGELPDQTSERGQVIDLPSPDAGLRNPRTTA